MARRVGRELGVPYVPLLVRVRNTVSQTSLSRKERKENISGAFSCVEGGGLRGGKRILVIDDIFTTGSTMGGEAGGEGVGGGRGGRGGGNRCGGGDSKEDKVVEDRYFYRFGCP